jgi:hypothetical protein
MQSYSFFYPAKLLINFINFLCIGDVFLQGSDFFVILLRLFITHKQQVYELH